MLQTIGLVIKKLRKERRMTQEELAEAACRQKLLTALNAQLRFTSEFSMNLPMK